MIACPHCRSVLDVVSKRLPMEQMHSDGARLRFRVCMQASLDPICPRCLKEVPLKFLTENERIGNDILISEGARAMSAMNPRRYTRATAKDAANKRWKNNHELPETQKPDRTDSTDE